MNPDLVRSVIEEARSGIDGEFASTSRVVDALLDLRAVAGPDGGLVELIDATLSAIPGRSVAPNSWWLEALDRIDSMAQGTTESRTPSQPGLDTARHGHRAVTVPDGT